MKAEILYEKFTRSYSVIVVNRKGFLFTLVDDVPNEYAKTIADKFNSALASHVQSELSEKVEKIREELTDEWIEEISNYRHYTLVFQGGMMAMRDEILNRLK